MYKDAMFRYGIDDQEDNPANPPVNLGRDDPGYTSKGVTPTGVVNDPLAQVDTNAPGDDGESQNGAIRPNIQGALGEITKDGTFDPFAGMVSLNAFNPLDVAVSNVIADHSNQEYSKNSLIVEARNGVKPVEYVEKINKATQEKKLQKAMADMAGLTPETVSDSGVTGAMGAYGTELGNNPQVPQLVKPKIGDNQALIGLLATALGGLGVAPEILKGLTDGAQKQADQENQQNQYNYQTQEKQHQQKLSGLEFGIKTATHKYDKDVDDANKRYVNEYRKRGIEVDDLRADIEHRDKLIQADEKARDKDWNDGKEAISKDRDSYFKSMGGWDDYGQKMLFKKVLALAGRHTPNPIAAIAEANKLMAELGIYEVGKQNLGGKKVDQAQQRLDETTKKNLKADLQKYIGIAMKSKDGWTKANEAEANKWLQSIPEEDRDEFLIPAPFDTEQSYNNRLNRAEKVRANKAREANQKASIDARKDQNKWMNDYRNDTRLNNAQKAILKEKQASYNTNEKAWKDKKSAYDQAVAAGDKSKAELKVMEEDVNRYKGYFDKSSKALSDTATEFGLEDDNAPKSLSGAVQTANNNLNKVCKDGSPSCAGWASLVLKNTGVDIKTELGAKNLIDQVLSKGGTRVARNEAQVGDLVYDFGPNRGAPNNRNYWENGVKGGYHVMVYAGNGQVYGSSHGKSGVLKNVASNYVYIRPSRGSAPTTATNDPGYDPETGLHNPPSSYKDKPAPPTTQMAPGGTTTKMAPAGNKPTTKPKTKSGRAGKIS